MAATRGVLRYFNSATDADTNSTATTFSVAPVVPLNAIRFGFLNTSAAGSGTALVLTLRKRAVFGTGSWTTLATLSLAAAVAQGKVLALDLKNTAADGAADGIDEVDPGGEIEVAVTTASNVSGTTAQLFIIGNELPFQHSSGSATYDRLANVTIVDES